MPVRELITLKAVFLAALETAQKERRSRHDWVEHERHVMTELLREELHRRGFSTLHADGMVRSAESNALGHVDYSHKFALGCAEFALYGRRIPIGGLE